MALTLEQKTLIAQILKDNTSHFADNMNIKVTLPVETGTTEEGEPIIEDHQFALLSICIQRDDITENYPDGTLKYNNFVEVELI